MNEPPSSASSSKDTGPFPSDPSGSTYGASSAPPPAVEPGAEPAPGGPPPSEQREASPQPTRREVPLADPAKTARENAFSATQVEVDKSLRVAGFLAIPVLVLIVLALVRALAGAELPRESSWIDGHLALVFFVVAGQLVCALLIWEHWRTMEEISTTSSRPEAGRTKRWLTFAAVVIFVLLSVLAAGLPPLERWSLPPLLTSGLRIDTWEMVIAAATLAEVLAVVIVAAAGAKSTAHLETLTSEAEKEPTDAGETDVGITTAGSGKGPKIDPGELVAIGASGGGIRAASFVLGGVNALQTAPRYSTQVIEPEVFAVSGGSYTAAAMALRRRFDPVPEQAVPVQDVPVQPRAGWREAFTVGSPELDYLRKHTRYLFEPGNKLRDGAISLLVGAAVNLFIVAAMLRGLAWLSAQIAVTSGLVGFAPPESDSVAPLTVRVADTILVTLILAAVVVAAASVGRWLIHRKFERGAAADGSDIRRMERWSTVRTTALASVGAVILFVGLPAAAAGIVSAVTHNNPTATVAAALRASGFGNRAICAAALEERVRTAAQQASTRAVLSPGVERSVDTGACGVSVTVSQTQADDEEVDDLVAAIDAGEARALAGQVSTPIQVGTILALLGSVVGLLTRGPAPDAAREDRWFARLKRKVVTWVPLIITVSVGVYLLLLWHLHFLLGVGSARHVLPNALFLVFASVLAFFLDANGTSMHQFYRERLSNAFAVGVHPETGVAEELPAERIYRFSDLGVADGPHLNVVTTLNTQTPHEVPTLRGGKPLVFGRDHVVLHETGRLSTSVPTNTYETFAGPGLTSIMATVAMSGAAISPLMGRYADQMKPYRILLTLFNLRVGMWMLNPAHTILIGAAGEGTPRRPPGHSGVLAVTARPGPAQVALEAVGKSSARERWVYVSDGGHLDNTAMVECVRHAVMRTPAGERLSGQVVILDASNDPPGAWSAVGDALNVIRADLGVDLVRKFTAGEPPWMRQLVELAPDGTPENETFRVIVVKAVRVEPATGGDLTDWHGRLPEPVKSIQLLRPDFPRSSTARQRFGDLEFEAYRAYGFAAMSEALAFLDNLAEPDRPAEPSVH